MSPDLARLPMRLTTAEVCQLARISPATLWRRIKARTLALAPCDRGRQALYERDAVLRAFGMLKDAPAHETDDWTVDAHAIREARSRQVRHRAPAGGRDVPRPAGGAGKAPALRLVAGDPAPRQR